MRSALAVCTGKRRRMRTRHHVAFPAWCLSGRKSKIDATRYFRCLGHGLHGFETSYHTPGVHAVGACVFYLLCARTRCLEYNHDAHQRFKIVPVPTIFITVRFFARRFSFALFNSDNDNNPAHATAKWYKCTAVATAPGKGFTHALILTFQRWRWWWPRYGAFVWDFIIKLCENKFNLNLECVISFLTIHNM